jgi:hypothetical protein
MLNKTKVLMIFICVFGCFTLASAQSASQSATAAAPHVAITDAKNHAGDTVTVCGKVVDTKVGKYAITGRGKPVIFDLDQPEPNPVFYFVTFGTKEGGPDEAVAAYKDKSVCVTGKVTLASGQPYIMAADRNNIKPKTDN